MNADGSDQHRFNASGPACGWWEGEIGAVAGRQVGADVAGVADRDGGITDDVPGGRIRRRRGAIGPHDLRGTGALGLGTRLDRRCS